jgi:hypothetical protein
MRHQRSPSPSEPASSPIDRHHHPGFRRIKRWLREVIWQSPALYHRLFELRYRGREQFECRGSFWIVGFQRSGNTFAGLLIDEVLYPGRVDFHLHFASSLRICIDSGRPGFLVIRKPLDAAISLAIFQRWPLVRALEDYIDLHRFWLRECPEVSVAPFEWFTQQPDQLITAAASLSDLTLPGSPVTPGVLQRVQNRIENLFTNANGSLNESQVARPSGFRSPLQHQLESAARESRVVRERVVAAESIRQEFLARSIEHSTMIATQEPATGIRRVVLGRR